MKVALIVFGFAGLIGTLQALPLQDDAAFDDFEDLVESQPEILANIQSSMADINGLDIQLKEITATVRPPQIHHNNFRSQGPFSGRLTNVVMNSEGLQDTNQRNRIAFDINPEEGSSSHGLAEYANNERV